MLELLNAGNGATLAEAVRLSGYPKSTAYRLLENLRRTGYLAREADTGRYFLTLRVRSLSEGFDLVASVTERAKPLLEELTRKIGYPVAISTPFGTSMVIRYTTDTEDSVLPDHYSRGTPLPLFNSASGKVFLAFCDESTLSGLMQMCLESDHPDHQFARHPFLVDQVIVEVREQGYAFGLRSQRTRAAGMTSTIAVPMFVRRRFIACLVMRYLDAAMTPEQVVAGYLGVLQDYAARIGAVVDR